ncbi:MAG: hypothetical protein ACLFRV_06025 [Acidimicrobiales bacterium]
MDFDRALEECQLNEDSAISAVAVHSSSSTGRRVAGQAVRVATSGDVHVVVDLDPTVSGGILKLHSELVLSAPGTAGSRLAPSRPGSILWREPFRERRQVILEGDAARFPTEVVDFSTTSLAESRAAWWLHRDLSDLDTNPLAALRLYVNSGHPAMRALMEGTRDPSTATIRSVIAWDVSRQLIHAALNDDDFVDGYASFRENSVGENLEMLIRSIWPSQDARSLRAMRASDPEAFEAHLQGRLNVLGVGT